MKKLALIIIVLAIGSLASLTYAADKPAKVEAPAFTVEQQAQIKTWNDRMVYLNQAKEKAVADLVSIVNEQSAIIRQYQALKPAKGAGKVDEKPTKGAGKGGEKK